MPVTFSCSCGRQMRAADEHAGKRVKCPGCDALNIVPTPPVEPKPEHVRFNCVCGKVIQAKAEHVGKLTRCPACGEKARIPTPGDENKGGGSSAATPAIKTTTEPRPAGKRPPAGKPDEVEDAEEAEVAEETDDDVAVVEDRPKKKKKGRKGRTSILPFLLIGGGAFLMLFLCGGGIGLYFYMRTPDDLKYVPDDAEGFHCTRLAEEARIEKAKGKFKADAHGDVGISGTGLDSPDVERLTTVTYKVDSTKYLNWTILLTVQSIDQKKILGKMFKDGSTEVKYKDRTIFKWEPPKNQPVIGFQLSTAVCFVSDRIMLIGDQSAIEKALDKYGGDTSGGVISRGIKLAARGSYQSVAANKGGGGDAGLDGSIMASSVSETRWDLQIIGFFTDSSKAQEAKTKAENARKEQLSKLEGKTDDESRRALRAIRNASISQSGRELTYTVSVELEKDEQAPVLQMFR